MFAPGLRSHRAHHRYDVVFVATVAIILGSRCVVGRPPQSSEDNSDRRAETEEHHKHFSPQQSALRFSPELLLPEPSPKQSNNIIPAPPVSLPFQTNPPSQSPSNTNGNRAATFPDQNKNTDDEDFDDAPPFSGDGSPGDFFGRDLDGFEKTWEQDPAIVEGHALPLTNQLRWQSSSDRPTLNEDKVIVRPAVETYLNVDRLREENLFSGFDNDEYVKEDLEVPELRLEARDPQSFSQAAPYVHAPRRVFAGTEGSVISSPAVLTARNVEMIGSPLPSPHVAMPDDVPADTRKVVPWPEVLQRDIDVDRPINYGAAASSLPSRPEPEPHNTVDDNFSLQHWKKIALGELQDMDVDPIADEDYNAPDTHVDRDNNYSKKNPFEDDDDEEEDEEEEKEIDEELIRLVIKAMEAPAPDWRQESSPATASLEQEREEEEEQAGIWIEIRDYDNDDDDDDYKDEDGYVDWMVAHGQAGPGPQHSRLITLIFESIGDSNGMQDDEDEEEEEESSADAYERELSIWQVLTNFPFPMLLGHSDHIGGAFTVEDYTYDDDDEDNYDEEEDYDEYYDADSDDEEYEVYEDEDKETEGEDESDELDDFFYSEEYDDCDDCSEDDDRVNNAQDKQEMTVLSLPSMLA